MLLLEGGAPGPLVLCVLEPQRQGVALLEGQDVVLRVEDGDLVQQGQRLLHGRGELGVDRHDTRRGCFYTLRLLKCNDIIYITTPPGTDDTAQARLCQHGQPPPLVRNLLPRLWDGRLARRGAARFGTRAARGVGCEPRCLRAALSAGHVRVLLARASCGCGHCD